MRPSCDRDVSPRIRCVVGGLLEVAASGRHRYFRLAGEHVAHLLETLAAASPPAPVRALRPARLCYDHIAGELGVAIDDALVRCDGLAIDEGGHTRIRAGAQPS